MAIAAAQKKKKEEEEEDEFDTEFWMVTFGDLLSLLLTFFVLLFSMKTLDDKSLKDMFSAFSGGTGFLFYADTFPKAVPISSTTFLQRQLQIAKFLKFLEKHGKLTDKVQANVTEAVDALLKEDITMKKRGTQFVLSLPGSKMFTPASSAISPKVAKALKNIGEVLKYSQSWLIVEGHTDDTPISTPRFASNWELSSSRASMVRDYLIKNTTITQDRISVAGYADTKPIVGNISEAFRARNRRVDIVIIQTPGFELIIWRKIYNGR